MTFLSGSEGGLIFGERDENLSLFVLFDDGVYGLYAQHAKADTFEGSFTHARGPIMPSVFGQSEPDEGLTALRQSLMVASQPTPAGDPGKAAFDHPSSGQWAKTRRGSLIFLCRGAFGDTLLCRRVLGLPDNLGGPAQML